MLNKLILYIFGDSESPTCSESEMERDCMRKTSLLFLSTVLIALFSCSDKNSVKSALSNNTVVPIRMVGVDPLIEIKVNGVPIDVHFDIGNGTTLSLFPSHLASINKRRIGTSSDGMSMTGRTGKKPIYEVDMIEIGGLKFTNARIVEDYHDDEFQESFSSRLDAFGFIGRGLFELYMVVIDYPNRELTIVPTDAPAEQQSICTGLELPLIQGQQWGLASRVATEIGELVLVWDTGAPATSVLKRRTDSDNLGYEDGDTLSVKRFSMNGHELGPETLYVWDWGENTPPFDGFIGFDFFADHVVCVDFPKNRIFVRP